MAGQSNTIEISYEQLSQGNYVRNGDDLSITTHDLWGQSETVLLKNYFETSPNLVTEKGSTLKGNIVNLLAVDSQPNTSNLAFEDPNAIGKITTADLPVIVQRADQFIELQKGDLIYLNDIIDAKDGSVGIAFKDDKRFFDHRDQFGLTWKQDNWKITPFVERYAVEGLDYGRTVYGTHFEIKL